MILDILIFNLALSFLMHFEVVLLLVLFGSWRQTGSGCVRCRCRLSICRDVGCVVEAGRAIEPLLCALVQPTEGRGENATSRTIRWLLFLGRCRRRRRRSGSCRCGDGRRWRQLALGGGGRSRVAAAAAAAAAAAVLLAVAAAFATVCRRRRRRGCGRRGHHCVCCCGCFGVSQR